MTALIELRDVTKTFRLSGGTVTALKNVSLSIEAGRISGVIGYSGAGKSTLVRVINGLERVTSGEVIIDGENVATSSERRLRTLRLGIGMIFQQFNLFQSRSVAGNVAYPLRVAGWSAAKREARVKELLEFVGLADKARARPSQLSGGQKQRVGIARALATNPRILLADEATSALDPETTAEVLALLKRVNHELGITIVVITHEMGVVRSVCDHVTVLAQGEVVEEGPVFDVFRDPQSVTARRFVSTSTARAPEGEALERILAARRGRLVLVTTSGIAQEQRLGQTLGSASAAGVDFAIVYGGHQEIQDRGFSVLTLDIGGDVAAVERFVTKLGEVGEVSDIAAAPLSSDRGEARA